MGLRVFRAVFQGLEANNSQSCPVIVSGSLMLLTYSDYEDPPGPSITSLFKFRCLEYLASVVHFVCARVCVCVSV